MNPTPPVRPVMQSPPGPETTLDGRRYIYFGGTSYLGLHAHPEVIEAACRVTQRNIAVVHGARRDGDPDALLADPTRIRAELGWKPRHSTIDEMIATAWSWRLQDRKS